MTVATYEGIVQDGQIRLINGARLPEQTIVYVTVSSDLLEGPPIDVVLPQKPIRIMSPRLADPTQASRFVMEVKDLDDAAV